MLDIKTNVFFQALPTTHQSLRVSTIVARLSQKWNSYWWPAGYLIFTRINKKMGSAGSDYSLQVRQYSNLHCCCCCCCCSLSTCIGFCCCGGDGCCIRYIIASFCCWTMRSKLSYLCCVLDKNISISTSMP